MDITTALVTALIGISVSVLASLVTKFFSDKTLFGISKIKIGGVEIQLTESADESTQKILDRVQELQESPQVFLSYSFRDKEFAQRLAMDLREYGINIWLADEQLKVGDKITNKIHEGILSSQWIIVLLSVNSVKSDFVNSDFISKEIEIALDEEKKRNRPFVLPVVIDGIKIPTQLQDKQYIDFHENYNLGIEKILTRVKPTATRRPNRASALSALAPHLNDEFKIQALAAAREIKDEYSRASALSALAPHLNNELATQVLQETLATAREIKDEYSRASILSALAPYLNNELKTQALATAREIKDQLARVNALSSLAPHLNNELMAQVLQEALAIANEIKD